MSYILEALKKAQAERQLGNAPTIHAPAPSYAAPAEPAGGRHRALLLGLGAGAVVAAAALLWLRAPAEQPLKVAAAPAPLTPPVAPAAAPPVTLPQPVIAPPPATPEPRVATKPAPPPKPTPKPAPEPAPQPALEPAAPAPQPDPVRVAAAPATQPAPEDKVRSLQELPEALQREIPKVAFGGYIYSPNAAERLLLVDKMLRREGEEVAPGLVLERILPKAAVMNYRGNRYRVGY